MTDVAASAAQGAQPTTQKTEPAPTRVDPPPPVGAPSQALMPPPLRPTAPPSMRSSAPPTAPLSAPVRRQTEPNLTARSSGAARPGAARPLKAAQEATRSIGAAKKADAAATPRTSTSPAPPVADNPFLADLIESAERARQAQRGRRGVFSRPRLEPQPHASRSARVEGLRIHAMERPSASEGPTVVLIHGAGLDHRDWTFQFFEAAPAQWRLVAFDRPGFGASARPSIAGALPATQARLLRAAAASFEIERAFLVGHSWGGAVVMAWGLDAPETVAGVASLAGAVAPWSLASSIEHGRRVRAAARMAMQPGGMRTAAMQAIAESFAPAEVPSGYVEHVATDLKMMAGPALSTAADVATVNGALGLQAQRYRGFARPVELLYGGRDEILSATEQGEAAARVLPNARLTIAPEAGHMIHHTHTRLCIAAIERLQERATAEDVAAPPSPLDPAAIGDAGRR